MSLFNKPEDRELYIKLLAELHIEGDKNCYSPSGKPYANALYPRSMEEAIVTATNQVEYDEKKGELRYSLDQLLTLSYKELEAIRQARHTEWCKKFEELG